MLYLKGMNLPSKKRYFSIGEVAKLFQVNNSLIRFWETEFDILRPKKNKKGNRLFTQKDITNLELIFHLVKERGFTLEGAKKKLRENKTDVAQNAEVVRRLREIKAKLVALKSQL